MKASKALVILIGFLFAVLLPTWAQTQTETPVLPDLVAIAQAAAASAAAAAADARAIAEEAEGLLTAFERHS